MKIDQLPIEMLMKIFSFLPRYDEVSLVNKLFYDVASKVNDPNICLVVDTHFVKTYWPSLRNSTRQISKVDINLNHQDETTLESVISIIQKFSASIKSLRFLKFLDVTMSQFLGILSLVPNVEFLFFEIQKKMPSLEEMSSNDDLKLKQLKKLMLWCGYDKFLSVFNRLPVGVLNELELHCVDLNQNALAVLFKRQTNIKKLKLQLINFEFTNIPNIFNNLKIETLEVCSDQAIKVNMTKLLSKQTKLKSIKLTKIEVGDDFINLVANQFTELERFSMEVYETPSAASIAKISKLKTLKHFSLSFKYTNAKQLESLVKMHNAGITALDVNVGSVKLIDSLSKSVPNLQVLKFVAEKPVEANATMRNFNFVKVLEIRTGDFFNSNQLNEGDCFNPRLMELIVNHQYDWSIEFLNKMIACYPNIKKFRQMDRTASMQLVRILHGFTKLESLELHNASILTMGDLNYLMDHKKNLKFIFLGDLSIKFTDELKRQLRTTFGVVIFLEKGYVFEGSILMAVDRNTMNSERYGERKI